MKKNLRNTLVNVGAHLNKSKIGWCTFAMVAIVLLANLGCVHTDRTDPIRKFAEDQPFLDCFTGMKPSGSKTETDCGDENSFYTYTYINDDQLLAIHVIKNHIPLSNHCQTFPMYPAMPYLSVKVADVSNGRWHQSPCSDVYHPPFPEYYYPSSGTITLALANFTWYGEFRTIENQLRLLALIDGEFINPDTRKVITVDNFYLGYQTDDPEVKSKMVDSTYRISFPVIKPSNANHFVDLLREKIETANISETQATATLYFFVRRDGTFVSRGVVDPNQNSKIYNIIAENLSTLQYPRRSSTEMPELYLQEVTVQKHDKTITVMIY